MSGSRREDKIASVPMTIQAHGDSFMIPTFVRSFAWLLPILACPAALQAEEEPWRFVSMPDFLNVDTDYPQKGWEDALGSILGSVKAENADFLLVPGDLVMGEWHAAKDRRGIPGIEHFAARFYPAWKASRTRIQDAVRRT